MRRKYILKIGTLKRTCICAFRFWLANWVNKKVNPQTDTQHHSNIAALPQIQKSAVNEIQFNTNEP